MPGVVHDLTLLRGSSALISPLWSLQWEMWFSLLLPLYIFGAVLTRRLPWWVPVTGLLMMTTAGALLHSRALTHLPMFGIGVVTFMRMGRGRWWRSPAVGLGKAVLLGVVVQLSGLVGQHSGQPVTGGVEQDDDDPGHTTP